MPIDLIIAGFGGFVGLVSVVVWLPGWQGDLEMWAVGGVILVGGGCFQGLGK